MSFCLFLFLSFCPGKAQKNQNGAIQADQVLILKAPNLLTYPAFWHGGDFVDHQAARNSQTVSFIGFNQQSKQRGWCGIAGERTNGY
jgi:hypothetical protein